MGKDLKGKELGVGISQLKNKKYIARITSKNGKRIKREFDKLSDCKKWIADARYAEEHETINALGNMTVDAWFEYWITYIKGNTVRPNTIRNYTERYNSNIKKYLGNLLLSEVKPIHCQNVLNSMTSDYRNSTIRQTSIAMSCMFESAVENELILRNPVTKNVKCIGGKKNKPKRVLTVGEQKKFLEVAKNCSNFNQYSFILQTGLRTGELVGLKWADVDFEKRILHVRRTMEYRYSVGEWRVGEPKSKSGYRDIPLTKEAIRILMDQKEKLSHVKNISDEFSEFIFISRKGEPTKNSTYDTKLFYYCDKAGIERFSMHTLRHTFATRCIEAGMRPKTLQMILGHANIGITMNLYVHVTEEEKVKEIETVEEMLKFVV